MKVRPSVKPMCEKCKVIRRKGRVTVSYTHLMCIRDSCTTAQTDEEARALLEQVGAPFAR